MKIMFDITGPEPRITLEPEKLKRDKRVCYVSYYNEENEVVMPGPRKIKKEPTNSSKVGVSEGWIRHTFIVNENHLRRLKAVAFYDRRSIKDVLAEALNDYLKGKNAEDIFYE